MTEQEAMIRFDFIRCALLGGTKPEIIPNEDNVKLMGVAINALEEIQKYHRMEERLKAVYGECDGLLETFIEQAAENAVSIMESHEGVDIGHPYQSRLLTDEDVDKWEAYKVIGTPDECRAAMEKQKAKKPPVVNRPSIFVKVPVCPNCSTQEHYQQLYGKTKYCSNCGQKLDWSDEEC